MTLIPEHLRTVMKNNADINAERTHRGIEPIDFKPVVKLFNPCGAATWLLTELEDDDDIAFGLCDLGMGFPELGYVSMTEIMTVRTRLGIPIERDEDFTATKTLSAYADEARRARRILA